MTRLSVLLAGGLLALVASSTFADDAVLNQLYGRGVHAYFAKDYARAHQQLSTVIDGGSRDPRAHFFRGLAYFHLGRVKQAEADFDKAATLEAQDVNRYYNVSKSLERVQGDVRRAIERHRVDARMAALAESQRIQKARYEAQRDVDRTRIVESAGTEATTPVAPVAGSSDPFATGPVTSSPAPQTPAPPVVVPTPPAPPVASPVANDDPFGNAPTPPVQPAMQAEAADPFATAPAAAASSGHGRRGGLLGALGKAIGSAAGGESKSGEAAAPTPEPAVAPMGNAPADPFSGPAAPAATPVPAAPMESPSPALELPSNAPADPFADPNPSKPKKPDAGDPFNVEPAAPAAPAPAPPGDDPFAN